MSDYKHGDWYCKPANEAEAIEIVERAVASGAELFESVGEGTDKYRWNLRKYWGVVNGCTMNFHNVQYANYTIYTIEQVREKFPLSDELKKTTPWYGKGLPPVGAYVMYTAVELENNRSIIPNTWYYGRIIAYYDGAVWTSDNGIRLLSNTMFRPVKTEREQWVDSVAELGSYFNAKPVLEMLYDALKSGDIKAPESDK